MVILMPQELQGAGEGGWESTDGLWWDTVDALGPAIQRHAWAMGKKEVAGFETEIVICSDSDPFPHSRF